MVRVIFTCFAGRRRYLEILKVYIDQLIERRLIDECHMWDYTRDPEDAKWLEANFETIMKPNEKYNWHEYYDWYTTERYPDAVIVKCDDDIVYIDVDQFKAFIDTRLSDTKSLIAYAGIINNKHANLRQAEHKILDMEPDVNLMYSAEACAAIHDYFLTNHTDVISRARKNGTQSFTIPAMMIVFENIGGIKKVKADVVNINFIAILSKDLWAFKQARTNDEGSLSTRIPYENKLSNYIDTSFTVAHMAFTAQREKGFDETPFLEKYKNLSRM